MKKRQKRCRCVEVSPKGLADLAEGALEHDSDLALAVENASRTTHITEDHLVELMVWAADTCGSAERALDAIRSGRLAFELIKQH
jgi:hypothetical protein